MSFVNNTVSTNQGIVYLAKAMNVTHCLFIQNVADFHFVIASQSLTVENCLFDVELEEVKVRGTTSGWIGNEGGVAPDARLNTDVCWPLPTTGYFTAALLFRSPPRTIIRMGLFMILSSGWA
jgi:hypothetical protein